jgi:hypothetical protein
MSDGYWQDLPLRLLPNLWAPLDTSARFRCQRRIIRCNRPGCRVSRRCARRRRNSEPAPPGRRWSNGRSAAANRPRLPVRRFGAILREARSVRYSSSAMLARIFHQTAANSMEARAMPSTWHPPPAEHVGRADCAVFGGRLAPGSGLLSPPIVAATRVVGCARSRPQTATPNSRALVEHPG